MSGPILQSGLALARNELARLPDNKTIVGLVGVAADGTIYAGAAIRVREEWVFDAEFEKEKGKKPSYSISLTFVK